MVVFISLGASGCEASLCHEPELFSVPCNGKGCVPANPPMGGRGASNHIPGAVPLKFGSTIQLSGTSACFRFLSVKGRFNLEKISFTFCRAPSSTMSLELKYLHKVGLVISSAVGPRPPVIMITSFSLLSSVRALRISSFTSPMATLFFTHIPILFNSCAINALLVSMVCPINNSSPIVIILALTSFISESLNFSAMYDAMKKLLFICFLLSSLHTFAQSVPANIEKAFRAFENDSQLRHAIASLYVVEEKTGNVVFEKNAGIGLAPASTQKIITGAATYELLGKDFVYNTVISTNGKIEGNILKGDLFISGNGDPTLGSWRYSGTKKEVILSTIVSKLRSLNIKQVQGALYMDESGFSYKPTPGGWIWDDIGNYYGAGSRAINWNENQYDLVLQPGKAPGDSTKIVTKGNGSSFFQLKNGIKTGKPGSGDNGYIYLAPFSSYGFTTGTIPLQEKLFTISGSLPHPAFTLAEEIIEALRKANISIQSETKLYTGTEAINIQDLRSA